MRGITKSGDFRFYANSWPGNQHIKIYDIAKFGKALGAFGFGAGFVSDANQFSSGDLSSGKFALNTGIGLLGFTAAWPASISYGLTDLFGAQVGGGAIEMLIQGQKSGIQDAMTFQSYQP